MNWLQSLNIDQLQWGYIVIVILVTSFVVAIAWRRNLADAEGVAILIEWFEIRGLGTIYQLLVFIGIFCIAWVGWRLPADIENLSRDLGANLEAFPRAGTMAGRLAQVVGALGFSIIAMRSIRFVVPVVGGMLVVLLILLAYHYVGYDI